MSTTTMLDRYAQALASHVAEETAEVALLGAYDLGRSLLVDGWGLLDVMRLHSEAVARVEGEQTATVPHGRIEGFLSEVLGPFEMAYLGFQEANASLREMTTSLEKQVAERTRELQESLSELQTVDADRRRLLARLVAAQEDERHRLADDLHDDTIQVMAAASLRLAGLRRWMADDGQPALDRLEDTVLGAIGRLRRLIFELRPPALDREGIGAAVEVYAREAFVDSGCDVLVDDRLDIQPPVETREILYRLAQEALANCRKHAQAPRVDVVVQTHCGGVQVQITDDGRGFDPRLLDVGRPGHLGVSAMRERAEMAGGWCRFDSAPGRGTEVTCWVPRDAHGSPGGD